MTQEEKDHLFAQRLPEYRDLFSGMDELHRALWFAVNEENELMSFVVEAGEAADQALARYKIKLLAIAAALESLPCAATEKHNIAELRHTAAHTSITRPTGDVIPEGQDYLSNLADMTPDELSKHIDELYKQTLVELRSEGKI